jgi:hypothetical protein
MKALSAAVLFLVLSLYVSCPLSTKADTVTYQFDNVVLDGGATIAGTFDFNTATDAVSNVNLSSTPDVGSWGTVPTDTFQSGEYFSCLYAGCYGSYGGFAFFGSLPNTGFQVAVPGTSLPPSGDPLPFVTGNLSFLYFPVGATGGGYQYGAAGAQYNYEDELASGSAVPTPEPSSGLLLCIGLLTAVAIVRKRVAKPNFSTAFLTA